MMIIITIIIISIAAQFQGTESGVMEAMIHIDSDSFRMTSFLQRFKRFIARSHDESSSDTGDKWISKFVHYNDTIQANYDFSRNQLTLSSSYSLLLNGSAQKISDVKITVNFRFNKENTEKIMLEGMIKNNMPQIEQENSQIKSQVYDTDNEAFSSQTTESTILGILLSPIVNIVEPIIVTFLHIIVNGVLGHALTSAFEQLYNGRLITV